MNANKLITCTNFITMFSSVKKLAVRGLTHRPAYGLLDHQQVEELKKNVFGEGGKTWRLKLRFFLKEAKFTLVQGSKDLWQDSKWLVNLYRRKQKQYFTGYEIAQSQRITIDILKFVPYSILLLIPLAQAAIPLVVWIFPNAVPSFYLFDTAQDRSIQQIEQRQFESHKFLIDKLIDVMEHKFNLQPMQFSRYEFFKEDYFQIIDQLDQHLDYEHFNSDQLIKVLEFLGGYYITGTATLNKLVNVITLNIPRIIIKVIRWTYSKLFKVQLQPYQDPWFVRSNFSILKLNYFPFENLKRTFLKIQINRHFRQMWEQDIAFERFGMDDITGSKIKYFARERGLATLSCYQTLKNVVHSDWIKTTTHPKFKNNNVKLWYAVMMYNFLKESSRQIN